MNKTRQIAVRLDNKLHCDLMSICTQTGLDLPVVARACLQAFVEYHERTGGVNLPIEIVPKSEARESLKDFAREQNKFYKVWDDLEKADPKHENELARSVLEDWRAALNSRRAEIIRQNRPDNLTPIQGASGQVYTVRSPAYSFPEEELEEVSEEDKEAKKRRAKQVRLAQPEE